MKRLTPVIYTIFLLLVCCKKEESKNISYWYVNNDSFSSSNITNSKGGFKPYSWMRSNDDPNNYFSLYFGIGYLPLNGNLLVFCDTTVVYPEHVCASFTYKAKGYEPLHNSTVVVSCAQANGKAQYTLPPMWFFNPIDPNDSVLIRGVFIDP